MLIVRGLIGGLFQVALFAVLLLAPAGTWHWPRAVQFLVVYAVVMSVAIVWLGLAAPSSLEARLERPINKTQPPSDRIATALIILAFAAWMIFIPLDVFRWQLLPRPPLGVSILGAMLSFGGYGIVLAALYQNAFAAPVVRHQSERGHTLVDTGLYGRVRHPFYTGLLVFLLGLALWLESYAAVPALSVVVASLVVRIHIEEKTLQHALPGYADYMGRVRYRLVPLIW